MGEKDKKGRQNILFKTGFNIFAFRYKNILRKNLTFSKTLFMLLSDNLFKQRDLKLDFTLCEMSTN